MPGIGEKTLGSKWLTNDFAVNSTNVVYPSTGNGGVIGTAANSFLVRSGKVLVDGVLVTCGAASTFDILAQDGTTVLHTIHLGAAIATDTFIALGGTNGLEVDSGISCRWQGAPVSGVVQVYFRDATR